MRNLAAFSPTPTLPLVYEGIRLCREHGLGMVLAVGGGSVIDSSRQSLWAFLTAETSGTLPFKNSQILNRCPSPRC